MKQLIFLLFIAMSLNSIAQTQQDNLDKYWKYRDRLKQEFLKVDRDPGGSIPFERLARAEPTA